MRLFRLQWDLEDFMTPLKYQGSRLYLALVLTLMAAQRPDGEGVEGFPLSLRCLKLRPVQTVEKP
jgi:hypothetical protein